eukprot:m.169374 g.169374  ORF g.169374 m.169374 type:complete len:482 (-) comp31565_c0_seq1:85-1530(-)
MKSERENAEHALSLAIARICTKAAASVTPPRPTAPKSLTKFCVTLKKSVYKDPSLHFFDVRRLYQCMDAEGLLDNVIGEAEKPTNGKKESDITEARQMKLLDVVSREAETGLKSSGASFLGAVLLQEKRASILDFIMLKVIGKGSFGKVLLSQHTRSDQVYAVKVMDKETILEQDAIDRIMSEHNVLLGNEVHPFLVGLHYSFQTPSKLYFVLDYVNGGELYFHLNKEKKFSVGRSLFYAAELTSGLGFLHGHNIIYRDLKPENILLDNHGHIMLTDFGLCKENMGPADRTGTFCGTPEYLAPEMLNKIPYGRAVDWWCLGCVTYEMIVGLPPFYSQDWNEMYDKILSGPLNFSALVPPKSRSLLQQLLVRDPEKRLGSGASGVAEIKKHPAFAHIDFSKLENREVAPPFNPGVEGFMDLRNFDPEVTSEAISDDLDASDLGLPPPLDTGTGGVPSNSSDSEKSKKEFQQFDGVGQLSQLV